jgi:Skp family chaperone for outer membrane proteins
MKIAIINFEHLIKNYTPYQEASKKIEIEKLNFKNRIGEIKREMETILNSSRVLVLDQSTNEKNKERIGALQAEGMKLESEFRYKISQEQNEILEKNFSEISDIVNDWSLENNMDMVINNNSIAFSKKEFDSTEKILDILKEKNLFSEWIDPNQLVSA